jgi:16S rRNA (uracil1498-N3)-methyltransferase
LSRASFLWPELSESGPQPGKELILPPAQSHHADVRRLRKGGPVTILDGRGLVVQAEVVGRGPAGLQYQVTEVTYANAPPSPKIIIASAVCKGSRQDWLIEKITELGVDELIPLVCERSVVKPEREGGKLDRWQRLAVEACKQSGRPFLPAISNPVDLEGALKRDDKSLLILAALSPGERELIKAEITGWPELNEKINRCETVLGLVGPEGGFSPEELRALQSRSALPVQLSKYTLRVETASVAVATMLSIFRHVNGLE